MCVCVTQEHTCEIRTKSWINASESKDRTARQGPDRIHPHPNMRIDVIHGAYVKNLQAYPDLKLL